MRSCTYVLTPLLVFSLRGAHLQAQGVEVGGLRVISQGEEKVECPLQHTSARAEISGYIARVRVEQHFSNPFSSPIEAVYIFPLPQNSAVDDMEMRIGERTIRGVIKKRDEARELYEEARTRGQTASLLEQERPNIFTQSVANILPGDDIKIVIQYLQVLTYDHGSYEYVFPMVVGPRYIPGIPTGDRGDGWARGTDKVPDAGRITPPVLKPGERTGHDIDLAVSLDAGVTIGGVHSISHETEIRMIGVQGAEVTLQHHDTIPNKDFVLRYDVAGQRPQLAVISHRGDRVGYFMLMIQPQADFTLGEITPKEMVFVLDCSGSMSGQPIAKAKEAMKRCIVGMNPDDSFQIIRFSERASPFSPNPLAATAENVQRALAFIEDLHGEGGTQMIEGIKAALEYPPDAKRLRIVCFMTDGYIGNEGEILAAIDKKLGGARLFSFGVGSSVNRFLLERMAEVGRGTVQYVRPDEDTGEAVTRFYERISKPYLTDITVQWNGVEVGDIYPQRIPDLFSAQPVVIFGRYMKPAAARIILRGKMSGKWVELPLNINLPEAEAKNEVVATLWARSRIKDLSAQMYGGENQALIDEITDVALAFRIMSPYTSFIAVEEQIRREGGKITRVVVPVPVPEGVSYEGIFGSGGEGNALSLGKLSSQALPSAAGVLSREYAHGGAPQAELGHRDAVAARKPMVKATPLIVYGGLTAEGIKKVVEAAVRQLGEPYVAELIHQPYVLGNIVLRVLVAADGRVEEINVKASTLANAQTEKKVIELLKKCRFSRSKSGEKTLVTLDVAFGVW